MNNTKENINLFKKISRYWAWQSNNNSENNRVVDLEDPNLSSGTFFKIVASNKRYKLGSYSDPTFVYSGSPYTADGKWVPVQESEFKNYKYRKTSSKKVKLNDDYDAIVSKDTIQVGCQTFPISILDDLAKALKEIQ